MIVVSSVSKLIHLVIIVLELSVILEMRKILVNLFPEDKKILLIFFRPVCKFYEAVTVSLYA